MPLQIQIDAQGDLRAQAKAHSDLLKDGAGRNAAGARAAVKWREHLWARNAKGNRLGGARTNYWKDAGDSVNYRLRSTHDILLSASQLGISLHYYGGTREKERGYYTIPLHREAHGKRAREISGLQFAYRRKRGGGGLQIFLTKGPDGPTAEFYYVLVKKTTHKGDKSIVPEAELTSAARSGFLDFINARRSTLEGRYN